VSRIQGGDHSHMGVDAFEDLYERHFDAVYGYLRVMLGDAGKAEEAVQEVFAHVFRAGRAHPHDSVRPWLFSIARGAALVRGCSRDGALDEEVSDPELMRLVRQLPDLERDTVVLRYLIGLTAKETAEAIGRNRLAVARAHRRALRALQHLARRIPDPVNSPVPALASASPG
jgi:RNA polymerase sigma-70 factor, ECF subfamily